MKVSGSNRPADWWKSRCRKCKWESACKKDQFNKKGRCKYFDV